MLTKARLKRCSRTIFVSTIFTTRPTQWVACQNAAVWESSIPTARVICTRRVAMQLRWTHTTTTQVARCSSQLGRQLTTISIGRLVPSTHLTRSNTVSRRTSWRWTVQWQRRPKRQSASIHQAQTRKLTIRKRNRCGTPSFSTRIAA